MYDVSYTQNRDLSWLKFNERVLEESQAKEVKLLEKLKFISIFDSNLDEFFMVRVGSLTDITLLNKEIIDSKSNLSTEEQLNELMKAMPKLYRQKDENYDKLMGELNEIGYDFVKYEELSDLERSSVELYFKNTIEPILNYQIVDSVHPFPHVANLSINILFELGHEKEESIKVGLVQVPDLLPRYLKLDDERFILLKDMIEALGAQLFSNFKVLDTYIFSVTRNADIDYDDDEHELEGDYKEQMEKMIKMRNRLSPVRLEINKKPNKKLNHFLIKTLHLNENRIFITTSPMRLKFLFKFIGEIPKNIAKDYLDKPFKPQMPPELDPKRSMIKQIEERDLFLSYPYESMDPVIDLLNEGADDPQVVSIKITLYRVANKSRIIEALVRAAENGKDVLVLMELRARFDESNNIYWSTILEHAGCRVVYGYEHYKCHSKVILMTRFDGEKMSYITQVATGNYNEDTATLYTDFSLTTANEVIAKDAQKLFNHIVTGQLNGKYEALLVAPKSMQQGLEKLIDEQIERGKKGYIRLKMNSISDRKIIEKLAEASQAGVKIDMLVRGISCILPGVKGKTDNIRIYSLVGRFLEHHRVYQFGKGEEAKYYISSADFMTRNIRRRVEVAAPIFDAKIKDYLEHFLNIMFADDVKIRKMTSQGNYKKVKERHHFIAQEYLLEESLNGRQEVKKVGYLKTPVGPIKITECNGKIIGIDYTNELKEGETSPLIENVKAQLEDYFNGEKVQWDFPFELKGTEFQKKVWDALAQIPYGTTRSYGEIARDVGSPRAARAVGNANHKNPLSIVIPCHRVIGARGKLGGYGGGIEKKEYLLDLENKSK